MGIIKFDIRHPNGQREAIVVEGERALIGSASFCDVRLPMDQVAYEHVLIEALGGTLRAEAKADQPPATINGMPLTAGPLAPDAVIGIGRIRLFISFLPDAVEGGNLTIKNKKPGNPAVQLGLVALFGIAAYLLLMEGNSPIAPPPAQAPRLFSSAATTCPQSDPAAAHAFGLEQMQVGEIKRERLPFVVKEAVAAVGLFQTAAACFERAGAADWVREATEASEGLKRSLISDFRARRIRLAHMLKVEDYELAQKDVQVLRSMMAGQSGPYAQWLTQVAKQIQSKQSKGKKKEGK